MIKAVLIDLDDTLLQTNMDQFLPAYLDKLANSLSEYGPPEEVIQKLYAATQSMIGNQDPTRTLKQAFDRRFYPALNTTEESVREEIEHFYSQIYPQLRQLTNPIPQASRFIQNMAEADRQVVIATNPLFPRTAITQRMSWSDIEAEQPAIKMVTSYEQFHFAKPNPEYYAEILSWLGLTSTESVMIGDDPINDLHPAQTIGIKTFKVNHANGDSTQCALQAAQEWIDGQSDTEGSDFNATPQAVLARLRGDLAALHQRVAHLSSEAWRNQPGKRSWSALEIVCHLRDTELEVNLPRIKAILTEPTPFLSAANPDEWAIERNYRQQDPTQALDEFTKARLNTIARLANLAPEQWRLPARHALLGPTTLKEVMTVVADHDLLHMKQLRETLNKGDNR